MRKTFTLPRSHVMVTVSAPRRGLAALAAVIAGVIAGVVVVGVKFGAPGVSIAIMAVVGYLALFGRWAFEWDDRGDR